MIAMKNKIKSQRGASITFALLLFLVCAIISSIVIVAATAAAGRMSGQVDMDGRYYAVTAVASKLKQELENQTVTLQYQEGKQDQAKVIEEDVSTLLSTVSKSLLLAVSTNNDVKDSASFITIPLKSNTDSSDMEESTESNEENGGDGASSTNNDGTEGTEDNSNEVTCSVSKEVTKGGLLVFDIVASGGNMSKGGYKLRVTFSSKMKYRSTDVNNTNKTAEVTWKLINMRKIRADYT